MQFQKRNKHKKKIRKLCFSRSPSSFSLHHYPLHPLVIYYLPYPCQHHLCIFISISIIIISIVIFIDFLEVRTSNPIETKTLNLISSISLLHCHLRRTCPSHVLAKKEEREQSEKIDKKLFERICFVTDAINYHHHLRCLPDFCSNLIPDKFVHTR